ncbi:hypothetical protein, partial [Citrobacter freundii]|uniref:hypothetical protein n=1 Tax=Citrobacter freundii TaxID=546 RepID=UPI001D03779D
FSGGNTDNSDWVFIAYAAEWLELWRLRILLCTRWCGVVICLMRCAYQRLQNTFSPAVLPRTHAKKPIRQDGLLHFI